MKIIGCDFHPIRLQHSLRLSLGKSQKPVALTEPRPADLSKVASSWELKKQNAFDWGGSLESLRFHPARFWGVDNTIKGRDERRWAAP